MNNLEKYHYSPLVETVLHPTDLSRQSMKAFAHALSLAMNRRAGLIILHAGSKSAATEHWAALPGVREMLEHWGYLSEGSRQSEVFEKLGMKVSKVLVPSRGATRGVLSYIERRDVDLIVLSTEGREGLPRWFRPSVAQKVAHKSRAMTLFVPKNARGFVSPEDGQIRLRRILLPADHKPDPLPAIQYAFRSAILSAEEKTDMVLLHVSTGKEKTPLQIDLVERPYLTWKVMEEEGDVVEQILRTALDLPADLIVMPTQGRQGFLDALRGSVTEQVIRRAPCPVLAVPLTQ